MINFRFHLISLVAVFLALAVGVAMGASFVDRATVETLRDRVDTLDGRYRQRGDQLEAVGAQLESADAQAAALAGAGSAAIAGRLAEVPVVVVATGGTPGDVLDAVRTTLDAAGASPHGTVRLMPSLALDDAEVVRDARERFGVRGRSAADVRARVLADLAAAMSRLAADPDAAEQPPSTPEGAPAEPVPTDPPEVPDPGAPLARPTDPASARAVIAAAAQLGLVAVDAAGVPADAAFPDVAGVRYVLVLGGEDPEVDEVAVQLAAAVGGAAPAVITVAEARPSRADGTATTTTEDQPVRGDALDALRDGPVADALSTVDDVEEAFGRIALVYAVAEQASGRVGHYGTGSGAGAPFPTVPAG